MKNFKLLYFAILIAGFTYSCDKCPDDRPATCEFQFDDLPQTTCQAYWESWFYNESSNNCEFKGYSGCEAAGFETKEECEACKCN